MGAHRLTVAGLGHDCEPVVGLRAADAIADSGASLARDVSHSRPHRVAMDSQFDVYANFLRAARLVASRLDPDEIRGQATVGLGDARKLNRGADGQFDAAMTSPPYLNAIDYLRGHRLALIWFGHPVTELKQTRAASIGAERAVPEAPFDIKPFIITKSANPLGERYQGWIRRYATDMTATLAGLRIVVRPGGTIMLCRRQFAHPRRRGRQRTHHP